MDKNKKNKKEQAEVHEELSGFDIRIDPFGKLESNISIDRLKEFLDGKINDKKIKDNHAGEEE